MEELGVEEIHVWFTLCDRIADPALLAEYAGLLSHEEHARMQRLHLAVDRHRFLVARALLRSVLSRYSTVGERQWVFRTGPCGKPAIANPDDDAQRLSFNLSHSHELVLLAVTRHHAIGVDAEYLGGRAAPVEIARRFFTRDEAALLDALPGAQRHDGFLRLWTLKEAYIKARGMGLSIPLDQFGFHFSAEGAPVMRADPKLNDDPARWRFRELRLDPNYSVAVCVERNGRTRQDLVVGRCTPLRGAETLYRSPVHVPAYQNLC